MLLGSHSAEGGVILLYETMDHTAAGDWTFVGKLLVEQMENTSAAECPCLMPIDGPASDPATRWVLVWGMMHSLDVATGRRNLSYAAVGWFDGKRFVKEFQQELDFGTDNYAFQAFVDGDTIAGIGWLANWADTGPTIDFPTAMTLPRRLLLANGFLHTPPIGAVESLRSHILDRTRLAAGGQVTFVNGAVEIQFELENPGEPFMLELAHPHVRLGVAVDEAGLRIIHEAKDDPASRKYLAAGAKPRHLRIFLDYGSIEVFADQGRWTGTKRIAGFEPVQSARLSARQGGVTSAKVWALRP